MAFSGRGGLFVVLVLLAMAVMAYGQPRAQFVQPGGNHPTPLCQSPNAYGRAERGDTLRKISQVTNVSLCVLLALNPQLNSADLKLIKGDKICTVPSSFSCGRPGRG